MISSSYSYDFLPTLVTCQNHYKPVVCRIWCTPWVLNRILFGLHTQSCDVCCIKNMSNPINQATQISTRLQQCQPSNLGACCSCRSNEAHTDTDRIFRARMPVTNHWHQGALWLTHQWESSRAKFTGHAVNGIFCTQEKRTESEGVPHKKGPVTVLRVTYTKVTKFITLSLSRIAVLN